MKRAASILFLVFLLANLHVRAQVAVIRGPYLQTATSNSIIIRWRTDVATASRVYYGPSRNNLNLSQDDSSVTTEHIVKLSNLTAGALYAYTLANFTSTLDMDTANHFRTLPAAGSVAATYRIGVFGDCGNNSINQRSVRDAFLKYLGGRNLDSWILLGDNAYNNGIDPQYQSGFFNIYRRTLLRNSPLWPSPGNHEYDNQPARQIDKQIAYFNIFSVPQHGEAGGAPSGSKAYYSFDIGNIHFISLDSYGIDSATYRLYDTLSPQVRWLKNDLTVNQNRDWVVVFFHHPPFTMGSHNSDTEPELISIRKNLLPILERFGVDIVLAGHSHVYERSGLQEGYYGYQREFSKAYFLSSSNGSYNGVSDSCPYIKSPLNSGTVYVVSGSAGQLGGQQATFPLPNMKYSSTSVGGAVMIEVTDNRLNLKWICTDNQVRDSFTIMKHVNRKSSYTITEGESLTLTASFISRYNWNLVGSRSRSINISPSAGSYTFIVKDNPGCLSDTFLVTVRSNTDPSVLAVSAKFLNKKTVLVNWQYDYADEKNIRSYIIERSGNNISYVPIATVPKSAATDPVKMYSYTDTTNISVRTLYYRIRTVDSSGVSKYSGPAKASFNGLNLDDNIVIAPNPGRSGEFRIKFVGGVGLATINVYDMSGRRTFATSLFLNGTFKPFLSYLPAGIYIVQVIIDDDVVAKRIVVL